MSAHINEIEEYVKVPFHVNKVRSARGFVPESDHSSPKTVSIGPHFADLPLPIDNKVKFQLASSLILSSNGSVSFEDYKSAIEEILEEGIQSYPETTVDKFCRDWMDGLGEQREPTEDDRRSCFRSRFLLDGCFIVCLIEALAKGNENGSSVSSENGSSENESSFGIMTAKKCYRDLCLLLNQIPLAVVQKLLYVRFSDSESNDRDVGIRVNQNLAAFCKYVVTGYRVRYSPNEIDLPNSGAGDGSGPAHLLDLVRMYVRASTLGLVIYPIRLSITESDLNENNLYSASMLRNKFGISFGTHKVGSDLELGRVKFVGGHFELPKVIISEHSETFFENLLACEDALDTNGVICTFMWLMGVLVCDERSVRILKDNHIIVSEFEDTKIVNLFKRVSSRLLPHSLYLEEILCEIALYKKSHFMPLRRWGCNVHDLFFGSIERGFTTMGTLLGILILIFPLLKELINGIFHLFSHESDVSSSKGW